jgi:hypothetical protein
VRSTWLHSRLCLTPTPPHQFLACRALDKNAAYPKAIVDLKAAGVLPESVALRQIKYLNNFGWFLLIGYQ